MGDKFESGWGTGAKSTNTCEPWKQCLLNNYQPEGGDKIVAKKYKKYKP